MKYRFGVLVIIAVIVAVGGVAGFGIYSERVAPFRTVVVRVDDDREVRMRYFVKRMAASRTQSMQMLNTLMREEIILKTAPHPPYDIRLSDDDVEAFARSVAQAGGETMTDAEYQEWIRQQLNNSGFSEAEFLDLMRRNLTAQRLSEYLGERVERVAEQVLLQVILIPDARRAQTVAGRLNEGESFSDLAREFNPAALQDSEGEWGWFPRAGLPPGMDYLAFDQLAVGEHGGPVPLPQPGGEPVFAMVRVVDRVAAREVSDLALEAMKMRALDSWFAEERPLHEVSFHGFNNGYDAETDAWVQWQIQRQRRQ